jgi:hypothetical protein
VPVAEAPVLRLLGLALLARDRAPAGLLIPRCRSVHTYGMRFRLDVFFLDRYGEVIRAVEDVGPRRLLGARAADAVLELPSMPTAAGPPGRVGGPRG